MAMMLNRTNTSPKPLDTDIAANENSATTEADETANTRRGVIRWQTILFPNLPLVVLNAAWVVYAEKVGRGPYFTTISLFANVLFTLVLLCLLNALVRRMLPRIALTQAELLLAYSMTALGAALAGHDCVPSLIQMIGHPYQFNNDANGWLDRWGQFLHSPLMVSDKEALKGYYLGNDTLLRPENWRVWVSPVLWWTLFVVLLLWTMQCLNILVRRGWQDRERLPFPIVEIPLQMTDEKNTLWRSRLFWIGFLLCATLEIWNGFAYLYPMLPTLDLKHVNVENQGLFANRPWRAAGFTCYSFYPFAVGLGYLLPLDLLFSCWFFYLFWKAQLITSAQFALDVTPDFPFVREQGFGGFLAILGFLLWNGRNYFREVVRRIMGDKTGDLDDSKEALSYRTALFGFLGGFGCLVGFMVWAGMSWTLAAAAFAIYFMISLAVTRVRAELGPPVHDLHFVGPDHILTRSLGTPAFSGRDLTQLSFFYWFNRAYRSHPQPFLIEALKVGQDTRSSQKTIFWAMMLAGLVGTLAVFGSFLYWAYEMGTQAKFGQGSGFANEAYNRLNGWVQTPQPPNLLANAAMGVGFIFCSLMMILRLRLSWWPFHPIGYAISGSWSMNLVWMPLMFAWLIKLLILRYGGVRLYRQAMPFFLGLILGQCLVGSLWHLVSMALGVTPYSFWGG